MGATFGALWVGSFKTPCKVKGRSHNWGSMLHFMFEACSGNVRAVFVNGFGRCSAFAFLFSETLQKKIAFGEEFCQGASNDEDLYHLTDLGVPWVPFGK